MGGPSNCSLSFRRSHLHHLSIFLILPPIHRQRFSIFLIPGATVSRLSAAAAVISAIHCLELFLFPSFLSIPSPGVL